MTLPIHPFVKDFCDLHDMSPTQLAPKFWYIFAGMWVLWHQEFDMKLPLDEFLFVYKLCQLPRCEGWFFFLGSYGWSEPKFRRLLKGLPSSSHGWKPMFFLVKGLFDVHPEDMPFKRKGVKRSFGMLSKYLQLPFLSPSGCYTANPNFSLYSFPRSPQACR